jgi:molecular chaperone GrpE
MSGEATPFPQESADTLNTPGDAPAEVAADQAPAAEAASEPSAPSADPEQRVRELEA